MAMTINTNVVSLNAQRNLNSSGASLSTTMQRLSSGLRVNSAKDDAAGLAISERMRAQSTGLSVAARNANDGISLAQTTEGALGKIGDMLQRQRELAVQASNATNSDSDRAALQSELSQLTSEIDRVAKTTSFNGTKVLDGSFTGGVFQVGADAGDNITIKGTTKATAEGLGNVKFGSTQSVELDASKIAGVDKEIAKGGLSIQVGSGKAVELSAIKTASSGEERLGQMVSAINEKTADTGVTAFLSKEASGNYSITLKSDSAEPVQLKGFEASLSAATVQTEAEAWSTVELKTAIQGFTQSTETPVSAEKALDLIAAAEVEVAKITDGGEKTVAEGVITGIKATITGTGATAAWATDHAAFATEVGKLATLTVTDAGLKDGIVDALPTTETTTTFGNEAAATDVVNKLSALLEGSEGYSADPAVAHTGTALAISTALGNIEAVFKDGAFVAGNDGEDLAAVIDPLVTAMDNATTPWAANPADAPVVAPASSDAVNAANTAALALTKDSTMADFNDALKGLTDAGWTGLKSTALTGTPTAADIETAVKSLQTEIDTLGLNVAGSEVTDHKGIASVDISTQAGAWDAIKQIDSAIDQVNKARGDLGALQTRFEKTVENIDIQNENISAAKGRIVDADFATETASLSKAQILQQAGTAMVAQANQLPQNVLSLLR